MGTVSIYEDQLASELPEQLFGIEEEKPYVRPYEPETVEIEDNLNIYSEESRGLLVEDDELSCAEDAFMLGYEESEKD